MPEGPHRQPAKEFSLGPLTDEDVDLLLESTQDLPDDSFRIVTGEVAGQRIGDAGTLVVVLGVSQAAIAAITAFLMKRRQRSRLRYTLEVVNADGSARREEVELEFSESEAPAADLVAQLSRLAGTQPPTELEESAP